MIQLYRYRFGTSVFDEGRLELTVGGLVVDVQPLPLQLLSLLLARGGEVVTREEFFERVWHGRPTVDNVLPNAIAKLRGALGKDGQACVETVPRVGYRFAGALERVVVGRSFASLLDLQPGQPVPARASFNLERMLGQSRGQEVWLARHAKTGERRVYKFASDAEHASGLKREATIARLLREQLGERPDFVRLIDWDFESAPVFLEGDYAGSDLAAWAVEEHRLAGLSVGQRIDLFLQLADAVAAAHSVAVLHKDLKPGNVLVSPSGNGWQLRLADFGSGRLLDPERLANLGITALGMTLAGGVASDATRGTLMYLPPEAFQDQPSTVRGDVFALGVLLYQLLIADLGKPLVPGWERDVSDELLRADIAEATDGDPGRRMQGVAELVARLRGLEERRAEQARGRAIALRVRQTQDELQRLRARRPWLMATVASLAIGLVVSVALALRTRDTARELASQYAVAQALNRFLTEDFIAAADPAVSGRYDVTVAEASRKAAANIDKTFSQAPAPVRAGLHMAMQQTFEGLSNLEGVVEEGNKALAEMQREPPRDMSQVARVRLRLAMSFAERSQVKEANAELDRIAQLIGVPAARDAELEARYWYARAILAGDRLALAESLDDYRRAWALLQKLKAVPVDLAEQVELGMADLNNMTSHFAASEAQFRDLLGKQQARYGPTSARGCLTATGLARVLGNSGRVDEGVRIAQQSHDCLRAMLGPDSLRTSSAYDVLAGLYYQAGRYDEAGAIYEELAAVHARNEGPASLRALSDRQTAAAARQLAGHAAAAEQLFEKALADARKTMAESDPLVQTLRFHLADCRLDLRHGAGVPALLDGLSVTALNESEIETDWAARIAFERGRLALLQGDGAAARELLAKAQAGFAEPGGEGRFSAAAVRRALGAPGPN